MNPLIPVALLAPASRALIPYTAHVMSKSGHAIGVISYVIGSRKWSRLLRPILSVTTAGVLAQEIYKYMTEESDPEVKQYSAPASEYEVEAQSILLQKATKDKASEWSARPDITGSPSEVESGSEEDEGGGIQEMFSGLVDNLADPVTNMIKLIGYGLVPPVRRTESNLICATLAYEVIKDALEDDEYLKRFIRRFGIFPREYMLKIPPAMFIHETYLGVSYDSVLDSLREIGKKLHARLSDHLSPILTIRGPDAYERLRRTIS